jgi:predicted porin
LKNYGDLLLNLRYLNSRLKVTTRQEPHIPAFQSKLSYGYKFDFPLYLSLSFLYNSVSYGDINHRLKIDPYTELELSADYQFLKFLNAGLELKNILNKKNYRWFNYNQKPFDVQLYLKARF